MHLPSDLLEPGIGSVIEVHSTSVQLGVSSPTLFFWLDFVAEHIPYVVGYPQIPSWVMFPFRKSYTRVSIGDFVPELELEVGRDIPSFPKGCLIDVLPTQGL